jgi:hypothetical protein
MFVMRKPILPLLLLASLPLGGCAASIAASAVGAAVRAADKPDPVPTEDPGPAARQACTAEAQRYGVTVKIIDTEYKSASQLTVWGTVEDAKQRRSFECRYEGKVTGFKLREITGR